MAAKINPNFDSEWTPEEWAQIQGRYPRRKMFLRVVRISDEAPGSQYLGGPRRRGLLSRLADRYLV